MSFIGRDKKHHFISQAEQRLNSINPQAEDVNQKIYSFTVHDRETHSVVLDSENGSKIKSVLCLNNLFSFDVIDKSYRLNFEAQFGVYENSISQNTLSLLTKTETLGSDLKSEVLEIFRLKFLNFLRNPYSVKNILNTLGCLRGIVPTCPADYAYFIRVLNGRRPQQSYLCQKLGISNEEYKDWLAVLFMNLSVESNNLNLMDSMITELFESPSLVISICVHKYTQERCLLSDSGMVFWEDDFGNMVFNFNLSSHSFIQYGFFNIDKGMYEQFPVETVDRFKKQPKDINVRCETDNFDALRVYNSLAVYQSKAKVFCSSASPYGINVCGET